MGTKSRPLPDSAPAGGSVPAGKLESASARRRRQDRAAASRPRARQQPRRRDRQKASPSSARPAGTALLPSLRTRHPRTGHPTLPLAPRPSKRIGVDATSACSASSRGCRTNHSSSRCLNWSVGQPMRWVMHSARDWDGGASSDASRRSRPTVTDAVTMSMVCATASRAGPPATFEEGNHRRISHQPLAQAAGRCGLPLGANCGSRDSKTARC